jgi:SOS-response transcriptional repressor LexA
LRKGDNVEKSRQRRRAIYDFIKAYYDQFGYAPTLQEVADRFGMGSKAQSSYHVNRLVDDGLLMIRPGVRERKYVPREREEVGEKIVRLQEFARAAQYALSLVTPPDVDKQAHDALIHYHNTRAKLLPGDLG